MDAEVDIDEIGEHESTACHDIAVVVAGAAIVRVALVALFVLLVVAVVVVAVVFAMLSVAAVVWVHGRMGKWCAR